MLILVRIIKSESEFILEFPAFKNAGIGCNLTLDTTENELSSAFIDNKELMSDHITGMMMESMVQGIDIESFSSDPLNGKTEESSSEAEDCKDIYLEYDETQLGPLNQGIKHLYRF